MTEIIPVRELRNRSSEVVRRAEGGEHFTVTVNGRPAAELGPLPGAREPAMLADLAEVIEATPVDPGWRDELLRQRRDDEAVTVDPWRE
jgi:prevent-host-death family protein